MLPFCMSATSEACRAVKTQPNQLGMMVLAHITLLAFKRTGSALHRRLVNVSMRRAMSAMADKRRRGRLSMQRSVAKARAASFRLAPAPASTRIEM